MEGHIQRAVLDVAKLFCYRAYEDLSQKIEKGYFDSSGDKTFRSYVIVSVDKAKTEFIKAKAFDGELGVSREKDKEVLHRYIVACFLYLDIYKKGIAWHKVVADKGGEETAISAGG